MLIGKNFADRIKILKCSKRETLDYLLLAQRVRKESSNFNIYRMAAAAAQPIVRELGSCLQTDLQRCTCQNGYLESVKRYELQK